MVTIKAKLYLLRFQEGGRNVGISNNYRPTLYIGSKTSFCSVSLNKRNELQPGENGDARIIILNPEKLSRELRIGVDFKLKEGKRVVAEGVIIEVEHVEQLVS